MASDVKFQVKKATDEQVLIPATISEELEQKFVKKARSSSIKLIPISFIVAAVVLTILFLLVYFLKLLAISTIALFCIIFDMFCLSSTLSVSSGLAITCENPLMMFNGVRTS